MLPPRDSKDFHIILKKERESKGLTNTELAEAIGINTVMIGRYEHTCDEKYYSIPSKETWKKLNDYLSNDIKFESNSTKSIKDLSIEDLIKELKNRGAKSINIEW
ncbi:TPA: helix-turn-helix transcriptional regulator [Acinetobacter baumannii]|nr:helix-turn-helix transcriptional regulator [Acinetobacter baumannii]HBI1354586.1 helix-turn-helix transcriptional regulator [Acinetobacter baumannii]